MSIRHGTGRTNIADFWPFRFGPSFAFLFLHGQARDFSASVPAVRKYRQSHPPAFLSSDEVERTLSAIDQSTSRGRRDYAVLLLLARLGLRASEVLLLELDDIHWRTGEILIRGKGGMVEPLPLVSGVGKALAAYIRHGRRASTTRRVFLRHYRPHVGLAGPASVGHIVRSALARAGVRRSGRGAAHLFRPSRLSHKNDSKRRELAGDCGNPPAPVANDNRYLYTGLIRSIAQRCPAVADNWRQTMTSLKERLNQYVALRLALGTRLEEPAKTLATFVDFLKREGADFIRLDLAVRWAMEPKLVQQATWARRLGMVRGFATWLSSIDPRTQVPASRLLPARRRRRKPHIFTDQEVAKLMAKAANLKEPKGPRALTYLTLIGLLSATGLRPGEATALDRADVDLENGILSIRQTKFGKSRFVPVSESTRAALVRYAKERDQLWPRPRSSAFLLSARGDRLAGGTARRIFAGIASAIGLRPPSDGRRIGRGPRLQDFRHSFATRRLIEWYRAGVDAGQELPKLATYLGHVDVNHTYWYIDAAPELLQLATERLSRCQRSYRPRDEQ